MFWFDVSKSSLAERHKTAYLKSLRSIHAVRVHAGMYQYKGYEINHDAERAAGYQWAYQPVGKYTDTEFTKTKAICIRYIDSYLDDVKEGNI